MASLQVLYIPANAIAPLRDFAVPPINCLLKNSRKTKDYIATLPLAITFNEGRCFSSRPLNLFTASAVYVHFTCRPTNRRALTPWLRLHLGSVNRLTINNTACHILVASPFHIIHSLLVFLV